MANHQIILELSYFLIAAITFVPLFKLIGLGPILGYLFAGIMIGPWALGFITKSHAIVEFSEVGVVLLFFIIGLEISPRRLIALKKKIFIYGASQVFLTTIVLTFCISLFQMSIQASFIIGFALAISSTAYAMNILKEKNELTYSYGQASMGILLFQDLAVIPLLAIIPLLSANSDGTIVFEWISVLKSVSIFVAIVLVSVFSLKPFIRYISRTQPNEIFIATCLLIVLGTAIIMNGIGLSMGLGAFLAGVLLANSEVKLDIEKSILPFKGLLMGFFFMGIGLELNLNVLQNSWLKIGLFTSLLVIIKFAIIFLVARLQGIDIKKCARLGIILCEAGEFSFIIFAAAYNEKIFSEKSYEFLVAAVIISMFIAPVLYSLFNLLDKKNVNQGGVVIPINDSKSLSEDIDSAA